MNSAPAIVMYMSMAFEVVVIVYFLTAYFLPRKGPYYPFFRLIYTLVYIGCIHLQDHFLPVFIEDPYYYYLLIHIVLMFGYELLFLRGNLAFKIFIPITLLSTLTMAGFPASLLGKIMISPMIGSSLFLSSIMKITAELIFAAAAGILLMHRMDTLGNYPRSYYWIMVVAPLSNMLMITCLKDILIGNSRLLYVGCMNLVVELFIYSMIWQSCTEYEKRMELHMIQQQQQYQEQHMNDLQHIVSEYHTLRHDMKNHFVCIDRLLSQNKYQELRDYFYPLTYDIYTLDNRIDTGNEIVNQILNIKYSTARQKNIPMKTEILIPAKLGIPDHITCSLLSNLLDNAIEASEKIKGPEINLTMKMIKEYLIIQIRNRIEPWQREHALKHISTKSDPAFHGIGHKIIENIVEKYNGSASFDVEGDYYVADVMILLDEDI